MRAWHVVALLALTLTASGCYTTVVDTGREPSRRKFRDDWVMGFASGLVMVERVNVERRCPAGVARVKTETSFANFLVQTLTAGLLSPRTVEVTCAADHEHGFEWAFGRELRHELEHEFEHELQHELEVEIQRELERGMERAHRHHERMERGRVRLRESREHHFH